MDKRQMKKEIMVDLAMLTWEEPVYPITTLHLLKYKTVREWLLDKYKIRTKAQKERFEQALWEAQKTLGR